MADVALKENKSREEIARQEANDIFCCRQIARYKPTKYTENEDLFNAFLAFSFDGKSPGPTKDDQRAIQFVKQQNFGPVIEKLYFPLPKFQEISEQEFVQAGYKRFNSFENYKCKTHNLYFELNAYRKVSAYSYHHKSAVYGYDYSRSADKIDLTSGTDKGPLRGKKPWQ